MLRWCAEGILKSCGVDHAPFSTMPQSESTAAAVESTVQRSQNVS